MRKELIQLVEDIEDEELKNKILNFKLLIEHVSLEDRYIQSLPLLDKVYNSEVPLYDLMYQLNSKDENIKNIRKQYGITQEFEGEPMLLLEGKGESEWGLRNRKTIRFRFDEEWTVYVSCDISFTRSEGMKESKM